MNDDNFPNKLNKQLGIILQYAILYDIKLYQIWFMIINISGMNCFIYFSTLGANVQIFIKKITTLLFMDHHLFFKRITKMLNIYITCTYGGEMQSYS